MQDHIPRRRSVGTRQMHKANSDRENKRGSTAEQQQTCRNKHTPHGSVGQMSAAKTNPSRPPQSKNQQVVLQARCFVMDGEFSGTVF